MKMMDNVNLDTQKLDLTDRNPYLYSEMELTETNLLR